MGIPQVKRRGHRCEAIFESNRQLFVYARPGNEKLGPGRIG